MDKESERINNWKNVFYNYVTKEDIGLLPLYMNRIYFFPQQDERNSIKVGLDDLHEPYATADQIKRVRELFEKHTHEHNV